MEFNLVEIHEAVAAAIPERECIVTPHARQQWPAVTERTRRLANFLIEADLGRRRHRAGLQGWESGQDHVALYLHNGPEYLEGMLGAFKAGAVPVNVNYRYVDDELVHILTDARARGIVFHGAFAPSLSRILPRLPELRVLLQVADDSGHALVPGAVDYEAALAAASAERPEVEWSPDDLYILYTGGTTGRPRGVLWRQADIYVAALGGCRRDGSEFASLDEIVARACKGSARQSPLAPFMHGAAHWGAFSVMLAGGTVVLPAETRRLDADDVWSTVEREQVTSILIVGDAFARPLLEQLDRRAYDLSSLRTVVSGGAILSPASKQALAERADVRVHDVVGSSEAGGQAEQGHATAAEALFRLLPGTLVLNEPRTRALLPGSPETGWLARSGRIPLGYLADAERTAATFPLVDGVRYAVPGDRAQLAADGTIRLLGRDSTTINSGGEKIYAEEVELAIKRHPAVADVVVTGRADSRWGQEVVALVKLAVDRSATPEDLVATGAATLARFKLPKAVIFVDEIVRSPSGKPDYRWARERAEVES